MLSPKSNGKFSSRLFTETSSQPWIRNKSIMIRASLIIILFIVGISILGTIYQTVYEESAGKELKIFQNNFTQHLDQELNFTTERLLKCQQDTQTKVENVSSLILKTKEDIESIRKQSKSLLSEASTTSNQGEDVQVNATDPSHANENKDSGMDMKSIEEELKQIDKEIARLKRENSKTREGLDSARKTYASVKNAGEEGLNEKWPVNFPFQKRRRILGPPPEGYCLNPKDLNVSIPFKWFCYESTNPLKMIDPHGKPLEIFSLGNFHSSMGESVYHFSVKSEGKYTLLDGKKEIANFYLNPEPCYCPESAEQFKKRYQCNPADEEALRGIFSRWEVHSITESILNSSINRPEMYAELIRVSIVNNTLHWKFMTEPSNGEFFYWTELKVFYASLLKKVKVPDVEFWHTHRNDGGVVYTHEIVPPVLAYGKNELGADIMIPTPHHHSWNRRGIPLIYAAAGKPWEKRKSKAFFRGAHSGGFTQKPEMVEYNPRFRIVIEAKKRPNLTDAFVTAEQGESYNGYIDKQTYDFMLKNQLVTSHKSPENALSEYKYVLNPDGNLASWRMTYQMATGALILKQKSGNKEYWYDSLLEDGVNHVELAKFTQDLDQALDWLVSHEKEAQQIASNAFHTWAQRMRIEDTYCWMLFLFEKLNKVLAFEPKVRDGMKNMEKEHPRVKCDCQNL